MSGPHAGLDGERLIEARDQCGKWVAMIIGRFAHKNKARKTEAEQFAKSKAGEIEVAFWAGRMAVDVGRAWRVMGAQVAGCRSDRDGTRIWPLPFTLTHSKKRPARGGPESLK
jgi:hypothetical protein